MSTMEVLVGPSSISASTSVHSLTSLTDNEPVSLSSSIPLSSSSTSLESLPSLGESEAIMVEGVGHAPGRLTAKKYKTPAFAEALLDIIKQLEIRSWHAVQVGAVSAQGLSVRKVSGSLTNAVFFVSYPTIPSMKTLLLRIYGSSSSNLISRPRELRILHLLSSQYRIGPRLYGTFENGRIEEFFESDALSASDMREPHISRWIGARMAELHRVDVRAIEMPSPDSKSDTCLEIAAKMNVRSWLQPARQVLSLPGVPEEVKNELQLDLFVHQWEWYMKQVSEWEKHHGPSPIVFAHNDAQYGNLLRLRKVNKEVSEHHQIVVVDFEYAAANPAAFDIANHFHEWTADYHGSTPHLLNPARYPSLEERHNFFDSYLRHSGASLNGADTHEIQSVSYEADMRQLEAFVRSWSPASHAMWAVWGIVQAREDIEGIQAGTLLPEDVEFDYLGYAKCRMEGFRRELKTFA